MQSTNGALTGQINFGAMHTVISDSLVRSVAKFLPQVQIFKTRCFFPDASINIAQNLLTKNDDTDAIVWRDELGNASKLTWADLNDQVSLLQQALLDSGVESGDRVSAWLPNRPETISVMIAAASIGAVFTSTSPDFGVKGLLDRFTQAAPKVLFRNRWLLLRR